MVDYSSLENDYLNNGFVVFDVSDVSLFNWVSEETFRLTREFGMHSKAFESSHEIIDETKLNSLRLHLYRSLNQNEKFTESYVNIFLPQIEALVGNELAIQRSINISIQAPNDETALLPLHSDVWSGDSPFEVVAWLPLTSTSGSASMFILPTFKYGKFSEFLSKNPDSGSEELFQYLSSDLTFVDIKFGQAMIFNQCLPHGNRVNKESFTRWSFNCRFKSLLSPYADKKLGEFFRPLSIKPATLVGLKYEL